MPKYLTTHIACVLDSQYKVNHNEGNGIMAHYNEDHGDLTGVEDYDFSLELD